MASFKTVSGRLERVHNRRFSSVQGLDQPIAYDQMGNPVNNGAATVTLDLTSGVNGQIANVTVEPTAFSSVGLIFFYIQAYVNGAPPKSGVPSEHSLPILISQD